MPFADVVGHARLLSLLSRAVGRGTVPPSLIFAGPEGVGKRRVADALAQAVNCQAPVQSGSGLDPADGSSIGHDSCGRCDSCRRIARGVHTDVIALVPGESGSIKIDQVREVIEQTAYRPFEGRRRVVIIDGAESLVEHAQSALLKTLEEPPPASMFVLVTARPDALLATVRSRCPRLRFGRLSTADIARVLRAKRECSDSQAHAVAAAADGSLGKALASEAGLLEEARRAALTALESVARGDETPRRLTGARALAPERGGTGQRERDEVAQRLHALASLLRDLGILSTRSDGRWLANEDLAPGLRRLVGSFPGVRAVRAFSAVDQALTVLDGNVSPKTVADWLAFRL